MTTLFLHKPMVYGVVQQVYGLVVRTACEPVVWWSLTAALLFMFTLVLSANLFSDAVRDAFDPRLRRL